MPEQHLHIISFTIPYPPNYGGAIDVFYKIRALHAAGLKVHLHCFSYDRHPSPELEKYCHEVHYYPRKTGLGSALTWKPYIVYSRRSDKLLENLQQDKFPILFEGLHSCYYLSHPSLVNRTRIYRESNIEHLYYYHLSKAEPNLLRKLFYILSSLKLRAYQGVLSHASLMLTVSREDNDYLSQKFPGNRVEYLPSFHKDDSVKTVPGMGEFALYQGNLSVAENDKAASFLVKEVFKDSGIRFIIAGLNPSGSLERLVRKSPDVTLVSNPTEEEMNGFIRSAQVNIMVTFQPTGLKLKLLNALFNGRHCLVNPEMVFGTELGGLCETAMNAPELRKKMKELMVRPFSEEMIRLRSHQLLKWHSNKENCIRLVNLLSLFSGD
ncbi:MAG: glycosyltransferase [Bacteroidetes bacterium]|nr:glycosyltransferase [Bacteroidota bacterium]